MPSTGPPSTLTVSVRDGGDDEALVHNAVVRAAFALLPPEQLAQVVANRVIIEQAKGMLMMIYGIDADRAFDVLRWRSQSANVKLRVIAEKLSGDLLALAQGEQVDIRSACDAAVLTVHERLSPATDAPARLPLVSAEGPVRIQTPKSIVAQWVL